MEVILSSKTSILTRATKHNIPEYSILLGRRPENLKADTELNGWVL
jgi:hypothetical protein